MVDSRLCKLHKYYRGVLALQALKLNYSFTNVSLCPEILRRVQILMLYELAKFKLFLLFVQLIVWTKKPKI